MLILFGLLGLVALAVVGIGIWMSAGAKRSMDRNDNHRTSTHRRRPPMEASGPGGAAAPSHAVSSQPRTAGKADLVLLLAALVLALVLPAVPAVASQDTLCLPTSGTVSGLTIVTGVNAGLKSLLTSGAGDAEPGIDCSGAPVAGEFWLDTSGSVPALKFYDGSQWVTFGSVNDASHQWQPPIGGGAPSLARASTTDLWSVPQGFVTITGTTTISKLSSSSAITGTAKFVKFAGALTLTQNATQLILPTGANLTTEAGDLAVVVALGGGNSQVLGYFRASGKPLAVPTVVGDSGSGGAPGVVPAPPPGSAALGKVLAAGGTFTGNSVPVGTMVDCACIGAPGGWLLAYGQAVSRVTYSDLWAVLHTGATVTVTIASPAVVTWTGHGLLPGAPISFATTGALPTGLSASTTYYVISAGLTSNSFEVSTSIGGAAVNTSGSQSGTHSGTYAPYGQGDYSTTFNLPDARGRVVAGLDNMGGASANRLTAPATVGSIDGDILGNAGGQETHVQTVPELAQHSHTYDVGSGDTAGGIAADGRGLSGSPETSSAGSSAPFNVVQPTLVLNKIIRF